MDNTPDKHRTDGSLSQTAPQAPSPRQPAPAFWKRYRLRRLAACAALIAVAAVGLWKATEKSVEANVRKAVTITEAGDGRTVYTIDSVRFTMVTVDGGSFIMGNSKGRRINPWDDEKPPHQVTLQTFAIGETEVTQALWQAVMDYNPASNRGDSLPVESVTWDECQEFVRRLSKMTGQRFRLPTEAEWEYAARGGQRSGGYEYSGSDELSEVAWWSENSGMRLHPVGTLHPNELGLYDMSGNVWEWCQDWKGRYSDAAQTDPTGAGKGTARVCRGGSCYNAALYCRVAFRSSGDMTYRGVHLGLRIACSPKKK